MEKKNLTEKESVELIARMIRNTQQNLEAGQGNSMLVWGIATLIASIVVGVMVWQTQELRYSWLWFLIPVIGFPLTRKMCPKPKVITFVDKMLAKVWMVIGVVAIITPLAFGFTKYAVVISTMEMLVVSIGLAITGLLIEFRAGVIGGCVGIALALFALYASSFLDVVFLFVCWSLASMIIPGVKLNRYIRKELEKKEYV